MSKIKKVVKSSKTIKSSPFSNYWTKNNVILTVVSVVLLTIGYILMSQGPWDNPISLTLSPVLLIIAYLIVIPVSIMFFGKKKESSNNLDNAE
ncbi:MAG TPA: hypothetical protein PL041_07130 [Melioribacteraceae bacterium]|nr:hypothetical protein [Melioribacteraceae bacterium]